MTEEAEAQEVEARDYEAEASQQGWKPREEYQGDPDNWVDAETFVQRGEQFVGLMKPRLDKLEKQLRYQEKLNKDMSEYVKTFQTQKQKEIEQLEAKVKEARKQAVAQGDGDAFEKAEQQLADIQTQKQEASRTNEPEIPEYAQDWLNENSWYNSDFALRSLADSYSDRLRTTNPNLVEREHLDKVAEFVKSEMPHKFKRAGGGSPSVEGEAGRRSGTTETSNAQTYNNLPPEAKATCTRLINEGIIKDKNEYARLYFEQ